MPQNNGGSRLGGEGGFALTNALDGQLNPGTHDLVPAIDVPYQPS